VEEVFELNMQLDERRTQEKLGEEDTELLSELRQQKQSLELKLNSLFKELQSYWKTWDAAMDAGSEEQRRQVRDQMVDLLNRRNYIRNLVRDVSDAAGD